MKNQKGYIEEHKSIISELLKNGEIIKCNDEELELCEKFVICDECPCNVMEKCLHPYKKLNLVVNYTKVFVTNITQDTNTDMGYGIWLHHVICDCTVENGKTEKQAYRIFSEKEYEDVINKGYFEIENLDD